MKKRNLAFGAGILLCIGLAAARYCNLLPRRSYTAQDFGIETVHSPVDWNENGADDYADFLTGARKDAQNHPKYDGSYYEGGFPPDGIGVCSDVVWRAFREAGYNLREMIDRDIAARPEAYPGVEKRDSNIDFRRVVNLRVFFDTYAIPLTNDTSEIAQWQPGDVVIFGQDKHIGIVSDKRNRAGQPYVIHNGGQHNREEDYLNRGEVTGHYRFDASLTDESVLIRWEG